MNCRIAVKIASYRPNLTLRCLGTAVAGARHLLLLSPTWSPGRRLPPPPPPRKTATEREAQKKRDEDTHRSSTAAAEGGGRARGSATGAARNLCRNWGGHAAFTTEAVVAFEAVPSSSGTVAGTAPTHEDKSGKADGRTERARWRVSEQSGRLRSKWRPLHAAAAHLYSRSAATRSLPLPPFT